MKCHGMPMPNSRIYHKQHGLALVLMLFLMATVSLLAIAMQSRQALDVEQAGATFEIGQAQLIALSAEDFAKAGLTTDAKFDESQNELMDNVSELWNSEQFKGIPLGPAQVSISIRDLQGLFNLNSMAPGAPDVASAVKRFERLLAELQLDSGVAQRVKDFMDKESQASYTYQGFDPAYSASGLPFAHPSELRLVDGVDNKFYETIEPYVAALPVAAPLNVNTTPAQVLAAWDAKMDLSSAEKALDKAKSAGCEASARANTGFKTVQEFWDQQEIQNYAAPKKEDGEGGNTGDGEQDSDAASEDSENTAQGWAQADFDVKSSFFSVLIQAQIDERKVVLESIIKRDTNKEAGFIGVIYRDFSRKVHDMERLKIKPC